jgi:hypothetical protein
MILDDLKLEEENSEQKKSEGRILPSPLQKKRITKLKYLIDRMISLNSPHRALNVYPMPTTWPDFSSLSSRLM